LPLVVCRDSPDDEKILDKTVIALRVQRFENYNLLI